MATGHFMKLERTRGGEYKITVAGQPRRVATIIQKRGRFQVKHPMTSAQYARDVVLLLAVVNGDIQGEAA